MQRKMQGVTLVELLIVLVVIAILASIAVPSYRNYLLRAQRSEGTGALLQVRSAQEKFFLQNNRYATGGELTTAPPGGLGLLGTTPGGYYTVTLAAGATPGTTYVATATAAGGQADDTPCQNFTVDEIGTRTSSPSAITTCWK